MLGLIKQFFFKYWQNSGEQFQEKKIKSSDNTLPRGKYEKQGQILTYKSNLIPVLKEDHQALLPLHTSILWYANNRKYKELEKGLNAFGERLKIHLRKETIDLYIYLEFIIAKEIEIKQRKTFREFRLEMKRISVAVSSALNQYENTPITDETVKQFLIDFKELGRILIDRIEKEEKMLYPIYTNLKN